MVSVLKFTRPFEVIYFQTSLYEQSNCGNIKFDQTSTESAKSKITHANESILMIKQKNLSNNAIFPLEKKKDIKTAFPNIKNAVLKID